MAQEDFTYILTVRETVDVQYKLVCPAELNVTAIEALKENRDGLATNLLILSETNRLHYTSRIVACEIATVDYIGCQNVESGKGL